MINQVSAVSFGRNNATTTLFSRQQQAYNRYALEPLSSDDVTKKKEHTALMATGTGIVIATALFALLGHFHANGKLSEVKDPSTIGEKFKSCMHKIGEASHSIGSTISGWFKK